MPRYRNATGLLLSAVVLLNGCVCHDYTTPIIDGVITDHGQPLEGATMTLSEGANERQKTQTDKDGRFSFSAEGEWFLFVPIGPQDRMISWSVNIEQPSGAVELYRERGFGGVFSGYSRSDRVSLRCDVTQIKTTDKNADDSLSACKSADE